MFNPQSSLGRGQDRSRSLCDWESGRGGGWPRSCSWDLGAGCEAGSPSPKVLPVLLGFLRHSGQKHGPRFGDVRGLGGHGFEREGGQLLKVQMRISRGRRWEGGSRPLHGCALCVAGGRLNCRPWGRDQGGRVPLRVVGSARKGARAFLPNSAVPPPVESGCLVASVRCCCRESRADLELGGRRTCGSGALGLGAALGRGGAIL